LIVRIVRPTAAVSFGEAILAVPSPEDQNAAVYLSKPNVWKTLEAVQ
jgi:hypothetical protein